MMLDAAGRFKGIAEDWPADERREDADEIRIRQMQGLKTPSSCLI
jgi:hypothetical protein